MNQQERILHDVMDILMTRGGMTGEEAVPVMIQWIAYQIGAVEGMLSPTVQIDVWEALREIDLKPLAEEPGDHLGGFITNHYPGVLPFDYVPYALFRQQAEHWVKTMKTGTMNRVLDECGGTGSMMVAVAQTFGQETIIYVAEPNVLAYRIALINAKLFNIPSRILNADYRVHSLEPDSANWRYAGLWNPTPWKHLIPAPAGN